jgi:hypothetical protein
MANHIFQAMYNLCRLNKGRQEEAAQAGVIPSLVRIITSTSPLRQLALPILCDLASAGKSCRTMLWQHSGLSIYVQLLTDPYFQVSALESILSWYVCPRPSPCKAIGLTMRRSSGCKRRRHASRTSC